MTCVATPNQVPVLLWEQLTSAQRTMLACLLAEGDRFARSNLNTSLRVLERLELTRCGERVPPDKHRWSLTALGACVATPPLVFLDMDGVVSRVLEDRFASAYERIDPDAVRRLNRIVTETDARFVSSSTWRERMAPAAAAHMIENVMYQRGFTGRIISATPELGAGRRGEEIQAWLDAQPVQPRAFAILDDWEPMGALEGRTVYTNYDDLLTDRDVDRVIALLSAPARAGRSRGGCVSAPARAAR